MAAIKHTIRSLNDDLRRTLRGGIVTFTPGVMAFGQDMHVRVLQALAAYDAFDSENDPYGEHDFGSFAIEGERLFFKITITTSASPAIRRTQRTRTSRGAC